MGHSSEEEDSMLLETGGSRPVENQGTIRPATAGDLPALRAIQEASPESAHWPVESYLELDCRVVEVGGQAVALLVLRHLPPDEVEVLNLAVAPAHRRRGWARRLLQDFLSGFRGSCFLEVRQSNAAARSLYESMGFRASGTRPEYYTQPAEAAVVMSWQKCYREGRRNGLNG